MVNLRQCTISCSTFWGYTKELDLDEYDNNEDIVITIVNSLLEELEKLNLDELVIKLKNLRYNNKYHIHREFGELLLTDDVIYICNH